MSTDKLMWKQLNDVGKDRLLAARGQLHQAVQLLTAVGISYIPAKDDDSHTAMLWDSQQNEFISQGFGPKDSFQLCLNPRNLCCRIIYRDETLLSLKLHGKLLTQVASDIQFFLADQGLSDKAFTLKRHFELPDYPDRSQQAFDSSDQAAFGLLGDAYANAYPCLESIVKSERGVSAIRTWPHHFDMAILLSLPDDKSIGIGMSPGDDSYAVPYYYVNIWPYPSEEQIKDHTLRYGSWHTQGWTGMVLPLDEILNQNEASSQALIVKTFLDEALVHGKFLSGINEQLT